MAMNAAPLSSPRLRRVLALLKDGKPHTTREIVMEAEVMAVNAVVAELRERGALITCRRFATERGWRWEYTMTKAPTDA